ncbi:MAG: DNA-binding transcriptional LysR family regulator [Moritella sp.]|jgi:DNA-binding transcriptional LysR family regulator
MPTFIVGSALALGKLVPLLSDYALPQHSIYAVFSQRKHLPAKVCVFLDFITAHFGGEEPYWDVV